MKLNINWHDSYYALMPEWTKKYSPPFGWYNYAAYFKKPHEYIEHLCLELKWFWQRGTRCYSDRDVWGLYSFHARLMVKMLTSLRKTSHGYPMSSSPKRWDKILSIMIDGFTAVTEAEDDFTKYSYPEHIKVWKSRAKRTKRGLEAFAKHYESLWD